MVELAVELAAELIEFPRHLSQHVGGYVLTQDRLDSYVPIGNARWTIVPSSNGQGRRRCAEHDEGRRAGAGMLTCIRKCFDLIADHKGERYELASVPQDEKAVYDMLCRGESLGVFQVESRAQMNMLPRLRPRCFTTLSLKWPLCGRGRSRGHGASLSAPAQRPGEGELPVAVACAWRQG